MFLAGLKVQDLEVVEPYLSGEWPGLESRLDTMIISADRCNHIGRMQGRKSRERAK